jgi:hypothetical protein
VRGMLIAWHPLWLHPFQQWRQWQQRVRSCRWDNYTTNSIKTRDRYKTKKDDNNDTNKTPPPSKTQSNCLLPFNKDSVTQELAETPCNETLPLQLRQRSRTNQSRVATIAAFQVVVWSSQRGFYQNKRVSFAVAGWLPWDLSLETLQ